MNEPEQEVSAEPCSGCAHRITYLGVSDDGTRFVARHLCKKLLPMVPGCGQYKEISA